jgi:hypothetical protein
MGTSTCWPGKRGNDACRADADHTKGEGGDAELRADEVPGAAASLASAAAKSKCGPPGEELRGVWEVEELLAGVDADEERRDSRGGVLLGVAECGGGRAADELVEGGSCSRFSACSSSSL